MTQAEMSAASAAVETGDRVQAGARGAGEYRCLDCGYGIVTFALVPECPMCKGASWAVASRGPFSTRETAASRAPTG